MKTVPDRVTRVAADLMDDAAAEGARNSRSAKQQLDHWARVGRNLCVHETAARRRVEMAMAGQLAMKELSVEERAVMNAEIDAKIVEAAGRARFGDGSPAPAVTTVAVDEQGELVLHHPDGTTSVLPVD